MASPATAIPRGLEVHAGWSGDQAVAGVQIQRDYYVLPLERTLPTPPIPASRPPTPAAS